MTRDELIKWLESSLKSKEKVPDKACYNGYRKTLKAFEIALATLQAYKAGARLQTYDYSERDWVPAECELSKLLEELER